MAMAVAVMGTAVAVTMGTAVAVMGSAMVESNLPVNLCNQLESCSASAPVTMPIHYFLRVHKCI